VWHCPFKVPDTSLSCAQSGPSWRGSKRLHCNLLWLWSFKIPCFCPSCGSVPLKYLVLFPHERILVPHGEEARDSTVIACDTLSLKIPSVSPSCGTVPLKYLVLLSHVRSLVPHGVGTRGHAGLSQVQKCRVPGTKA
jgi:hypothetical protein